MAAAVQAGQPARPHLAEVDPAGAAVSEVGEWVAVRAGEGRGRRPRSSGWEEARMVAPLTLQLKPPPPTLTTTATSLVTATARCWMEPRTTTGASTTLAIVLLLKAQAWALAALQQQQAPQCIKPPPQLPAQYLLVLRPMAQAWASTLAVLSHCGNKPCHVGWGHHHSCQHSTC